MILRTVFILIALWLVACSGGSGGGTVGSDTGNDSGKTPQDSGNTPQGEGTGEKAPAPEGVAPTGAESGIPVKLRLVTPQATGVPKARGMPALSGIDLSLYHIDAEAALDRLLGACPTDTTGSCTIFVNPSLLGVPGAEVHLMAVSSVGINAMITTQVIAEKETQINLSAESGMAADLYRAQCEARRGSPIKPGEGMFQCVSGLMPACMEKAMRELMMGQQKPDGTVQTLFQWLREACEAAFLEAGVLCDFAGFIRGDEEAIKQMAKLMKGAPAGVAADMGVLMEKIASTLQLLDESYCRIEQKQHYEEMVKTMGSQTTFTILQNCPLAKMDAVSPEMIDDAMKTMMTMPEGFDTWQKPDAVQTLIDKMIHLDADPEATHEDKAEMMKTMMTEMMENSGTGQPMAPWDHSGAPHPDPETTNPDPGATDEEKAELMKKMMIEMEATHPHPETTH